MNMHDERYITSFENMDVAFKLPCKVVAQISWRLMYLLFDRDFEHAAVSGDGFITDGGAHTPGVSARQVVAHARAGFTDRAQRGVTQGRVRVTIM